MDYLFQHCSFLFFYFFSLSYFYVQQSGTTHCMTAHITPRERGVLTKGTLSVNVWFELGRKVLEMNVFAHITSLPSRIPFPLIFPWRSIKRQPFERMHWFSGISCDKMHLCTHSPFNYSIWGPPNLGGSGKELYTKPQIVREHRRQEVRTLSVLKMHRSRVMFMYFKTTVDEKIIMSKTVFLIILIWVYFYSPKQNCSTGERDCVFYQNEVIACLTYLWKIWSRPYWAVGMKKWFSFRNALKLASLSGH